MADFDRNATPDATPYENGLVMSPYPVDLYGADTKSRTRDLLITNQLLYQLSYVGFGGRIIRILALYGKGE